MTRFSARPYGDAGILWYVEDANLGACLVEMCRNREQAEAYAAELNERERTICELT